MITISDPFENDRYSRRSKRGMTIAEVMFSVIILSLVIVSMLGAFLLFAKGAASVTDYSVMSMEGRRAIETMSRDFRSASDIPMANKTTIQLEMPAYVTENWVEYSYDLETQELHRFEYDQNDKLVQDEVMLTTLKECNWVYYDRLGTLLKVNQKNFLAAIKSVQMNAQSTRSISESEISSHIITPRFMLRNRKSLFKVN